MALNKCVIMKEILIVLMVMSNLLSNYGCNGQESDDKPTGYNIVIFKNTPAMSIAKAIQKEDTVRLKKLLKEHPELLNFREPVYGQSLINWSVFIDKYNATKVLAELGADVNLIDSSGRNAFLVAAYHQLDSRYLRLLLQYGGDIHFVNPIEKDGLSGPTPLIAATYNLENVKMLVEAGADIDYIYPDSASFRSAVNEAALMGRVEVLRYLIIEKGAKYNLPYRIDDKGIVFYIIDKLKEMYVPPGDEDAEWNRIRLELIAFIEKGGNVSK